MSYKPGDLVQLSTSSRLLSKLQLSETHRRISTDIYVNQFTPALIICNPHDKQHEGATYILTPQVMGWINAGKLRKIK